MLHCDAFIIVLSTRSLKSINMQLASSWFTLHTTLNQTSHILPKTSFCHWGFSEMQWLFKECICSILANVLTSNLHLTPSKDQCLGLYLYQGVYSYKTISLQTKVCNVDLSVRYQTWEKWEIQIRKKKVRNILCCPSFPTYFYCMRSTD